MKAKLTTTLAVGLAAGLALTGCSAEADSGAPVAPRVTTAPTAGAPTTPAPSQAAPVVPEVSVRQTLATGLDVPWGIAYLPDGSALVAQRPTGDIVRVPADGGEAIEVGTVRGVSDLGEGGLLGLAVSPAEDEANSAEEADDVTLYAYLTSTEGDNRVVRMPFDGERLGAATEVLTGIPSGRIHNGGLLTFGPDGMLWIGTGEAGQVSRSQDRDDLGGKILRIEPDGSVPTDNPFPGSPVYSLGHRNIQGLAFDSTDQPWSADFGQDTWDELNRIVPGGNYGWPEVEGQEAREGFIEPLVQWATDEASPSGMAIVDDVAYLGGLRGERLWQVPLNGETTGTPRDHLRGEFGRIRNVAAAPGGGLWITTSNRDGRGDPGREDDRVIGLDLLAD